MATSVTTMSELLWIAPQTFQVVLERSGTLTSYSFLSTFMKRVS